MGQKFFAARHLGGGIDIASWMRVLPLGLDKVENHFGAISLYALALQVPAALPLRVDQEKRAKLHPCRASYPAVRQRRPSPCGAPGVCVRNVSGRDDSVSVAACFDACIDVVPQALRPPPSPDRLFRVSSMVPRRAAHRTGSVVLPPTDDRSGRFVVPGFISRLSQTNVLSRCRAMNCRHHRCAARRNRVLMSAMDDPFR